MLYFSDGFTYQAASSGTSYVGAVWDPPTVGFNFQNLTKINGNPYPSPTQIFTHETPVGSNGGTAPSALTFNQYPIDTAYPALSGSNSTTIAGLSLTSNVLTFPAGTFKVSAAVGHAMDNGQARLFDLTASNVALLGTVVGADQRTSYSLIDGFVSPSNTTNYEVQIAGASLTGGDADYGQAGNFGTEKFMSLEITKIA